MVPSCKFEIYCKISGVWLAMIHPLHLRFLPHKRNMSSEILFSLKSFTCVAAFCLTSIDICNYWNQGNLTSGLCSESIVIYMKIRKPQKHPITLLKCFCSCGLKKYSHLNISLQIHSLPNVPFLTYLSKAKLKHLSFTCPPGSLDHRTFSVSHNVKTSCADLGQSPD